MSKATGNGIKREGNDPEPIPEPDILLHCWHEISRDQASVFEKCCWCVLRRVCITARTVPVPGHGPYALQWEQVSDEDPQPKPYEGAVCQTRGNDA